MCWLRLIIAFFVFSLFQPISAQENRWTHFGARPLGMGNAFVAVSDDFNALFYNPAGLARLKETDWEFLNFYGEISQSTGSFISDLQDFASGSAGGTEEVLSLIEKQTGEVQHLALGLTPHLVFKHFGIGAGMQFSGNIVFHRYPSVDMRLGIGPDVVIPISFAMNFLENRLSIGAGIKARVRGGIAHDFSLEDIQAFSGSDDEDSSSSSSDEPKLEDFVSGGMGYGADFGLLFTPIKPMEPTLGLSITDIGGTSFEEFDVSGDAKLGAPEIVQASVNVGVSLKPIKTDSYYVLTAVDIHSANRPLSFSKKFNLGVEWGWGEIFKVQTGLHQGYFTAGLQVDVNLLAVRFTTYGEELSPVAGSLEDRRYLLQLYLLL